MSLATSEIPEPTLAGDTPGAGAVAGAGSGGLQGGAGLGGNIPKPRKNNRSQQQKVRNQGGVRTVRWYSVNGPELQSLATLQGAGALMATIGTFLSGVWLSTKQGIEMAAEGDIRATTKASWEAAQSLCGWGAVGAFVLSAILLGLNGLAIWRIYKEHEHG